MATGVARATGALPATLAGSVPLSSKCGNDADDHVIDVRRIGKSIVKRWHGECGTICTHSAEHPGDLKGRVSRALFPRFFATTHSFPPRTVAVRLL